MSLDVAAVIDRMHRATPGGLEASIVCESENDGEAEGSESVEDELHVLDRSAPIGRDRPVRSQGDRPLHPSHVEVVLQVEVELGDRRLHVKRCFACQLSSERVDFLFVDVLDPHLQVHPESSVRVTQGVARPPIARFDPVGIRGSLTCVAMEADGRERSTVRRLSGDCRHRKRARGTDRRGGERDAKPSAALAPSAADHHASSRGCADVVRLPPFCRHPHTPRLQRGHVNIPRLWFLDSRQRCSPHEYGAAWVVG
jgi:hypothetical protein